jgi:acetolactate synthase-1/2/3 large subunit
MKLSDYLTEYLANYGVTHVFGYAGGAVTHILDSIYKRKDIEFVSVYHEQAAAFAAEGYARIKNNIGVALATSGPGATNLITGIGSAYFDSIPCLYITGQVNTYEYKGDLSVRQLGFQETDIISIVKPITKYAVRICEPELIKYELQKAIAIAMEGRKGPVLLDIPMDIQRAEIDVSSLKEYENDAFQGEDESWLNQVIHMINNSSRPVILAGGGVRTGGAVELLKSFVEGTGIPVVSSLMGLDAYYGKQSLGLIGAYGNRYGNFTLANSDLILCLGSRLDTRQTGTNIESFAREAALIRVDIDDNELQRKLKDEELALHMNVYDFLTRINQHLNLIAPQNLERWNKIVESYREQYPSYSSRSLTDPNYVMNYLSREIEQDAVICTDVGQNQMWAAQSFELKPGQRLLTSGGMGTMGFSLPAAIGAYFATSNRPIYAIAGDGGFQMNIQELQLIIREKLPIKIIVLNNGCLGMIRHFQEMYFESRYGGTIIGYQAPDFIKIAQAYGINAYDIKNEEELEDIGKLLHSEGAALIQIHLPRNTYVFPKLAVNRPIEDQEPLLEREEFERNMLIKAYRKGNE